MKRVPRKIVAEQWRDRLERFKQSGLTIERFCQSEGVSAGSLYRWQKRLASQETCEGENVTASITIEPLKRQHELN